MCGSLGLSPRQQQRPSSLLALRDGSHRSSSAAACVQRSGGPSLVPRLHCVHLRRRLHAGGQRQRALRGERKRARPSDKNAGSLGSHKTPLAQGALFEQYAAEKLANHSTRRGVMPLLLFFSAHTAHSPLQVPKGAAVVVSFLAADLTDIYLCGVCSCQKY